MSIPIVYTDRMIIAVDIGGTKTLVASFDGLTLLKETRFVTNSDTEAFLADLLPVLREHTESQMPAAICLAVPGILNLRSGTVVRCGNLPWENFGLRSALAQHFTCPIYLENDANLAGLSEARALSPVPRLCLYLTVSTGIGSGIIVKGKIISALSGSEAGWMTLRRPDAGSDNGFAAWQSYASGKALHARTDQLASDITDQKVWRDIAERVSDGLLALIPALQPDVIIIGGGVGTHFTEHWRDALTDIMKERLPAYIDLPPIEQAQHAEEAVLYGCCYYAEDKLHG